MHEKIFRVFAYQTDAPTLLSKFHIFFILATVVGTIFFTTVLKNASETSFRIFLMLAWVILVLGEIYREIVFSYTLVDGEFVFDYGWSHFPFQICSAPLYLIPPVALLKKGILRDASACFLAVWSLFGGLAVIVYPGEVFSEFRGVCIQSLFHHGSQVVIGAVIAARNAKRLNLSFFAKGYAMFVLYLGIAMYLNDYVHKMLIENGQTDYFSLCYISPYYESIFPFLEKIRAATSYNTMLISYIAGFTLIAIIVYSAERALTKKSRRSFI